MRPASDWVVILLCLVAAGLSVWLTVQKLTGRIDSLAGCGGDSGCENVLGSRWSVVLGTIPVSIFSSLLYLGIVASLFIRGGGARWFRLFAALLVAGSAVWFTALQLVAVKTICRYCMAMHGFGVVTALLLLVREKKRGARPAAYISGLAAALACVAGLAAVQCFGPAPDTHRVDTGVTLDRDGAESPSGPHTRGEGRLVTFFDGRKSYRVSSLPHIGPADADHVIVEYFDYTCESCGDVHGYLEKIRAKYPGELAVIVLPVPLDRSCNPHLPPGVEDHARACDLARLALRVWMADPGKFPEFHHWLFQYHRQPVEVAEAKAYSLVGGDRLDSVPAEEIEALLEQNVSDYGELARKTHVLPKIVLKGSKVVQGGARGAPVLEGLLREHLGLGDK